MKHYYTGSLGPSAKIAYWNGLHSALFAPLEVEPADIERFEAAFDCDLLGPLTIARTNSLPATIRHSEQHVARTAVRHFSLLMALRGTLRICHYGQDATVKKGDFVLLDDAAPFRIEFDEPNRAIGVRALPELLMPYVPAPESVCGRAVTGSTGIGSVVRAMLVSLWTQVESGVLEECGDLLAKSFLEVAGGSLAMTRGSDERSAAPSVRRAQIKRFIENRLRDRELTPSMIARHFGISPRYVRMVFAAEREHLSDYILRRRLDECAAQLGSSLWRGYTITDIAFSWGFNAMPHFARVFKRRFGMTPSQYRFERAAQDHADRLEQSPP